MNPEKIWNWQQKDWPQFHFDKLAVEELDANFLLQEKTFRLRGKVDQ